MSLKIQDLLTGGYVNCFELEGPKGNYVLVLAGVSKGYVVPLLTVPGTGNVAFLGSGLSMNESVNIQDFIMTSLPTAYKKLPKFGLIMQTAAPTHNMKIKSFVELTCKNGAKAEDKLLFKYLQDAGYDVSNLTKTIKASTKERDYSALRATPEGQLRYDAITDIIKKIDGKLANCDTQVKIAYEAIKQGKTNGLILTGPAGTGKSVAAFILSHEMGAPLITFQASEGMQVEDMIGEFKPSDDPAKQFEFCLGLLLKAYSEGYQMLIDEVNTAPAGILSIINQFMDDTPTITQKGVIYKRHPNFVLYMTLNPGYEGTQIMNQALKSRFAKAVINNISVSDFIFRMVTYSKNRCGCQLDEDFYKELYDFQPVISTQANNCGESVAICIRNAQQLTDAITTHSMNEEEFTEAVHMAYTNNIYMDNDNLANLNTFKQTEELKTRIKKLFNLYNYRVIKSVEIKGDVMDLIDTPVVASSKSSRVVDDFEDDDFAALDSVDDDIAQKLSDEIDESEDEEADGSKSTSTKKDEDKESEEAEVEDDDEEGSDDPDEDGVTAY